MAATTFDKVLPPIVFLTALLGAFIILLSAMNPTIESNKQANNNVATLPGIPDFEHLMFQNNSEIYLTPNPRSINASDRITNYPILPDSKAITFSCPGESNFKIKMWVVGKELGDISGDRHELFFSQVGGWFGIQNYGNLVVPGAFVGTTYSNGTAGVYMAHIKLRHTYDIFITNGPGSTGGGASISDDYYAYNYNITIGYPANATSANPWTIVAGLFTFNLPGVPYYVTALIMGPIYITIAMTAYILVRSALPM